MTPVHLHLALNHLAVVGIPIALILAIRGFYTDDKAFLPWVYKFIVFLSFVTIVVYLTGEPTEESVEHIAGISEKLIEPHEDAAGVSLVLTILSGLVAFGGIVATQRDKATALVHKLVLVSLLLSAASLGYTALQGGKIHHEEIRDGAVTASATEQMKDDDDD